MSIWERLYWTWLYLVGAVNWEDIPSPYAEEAWEIALKFMDQGRTYSLDELFLVSNGIRRNLEHCLQKLPEDPAEDQFASYWDAETITNDWVWFHLMERKPGVVVRDIVIEDAFQFGTCLFVRISSKDFGVWRKLYCIEQQQPAVLPSKQYLYPLAYLFRPAF